MATKLAKPRDPASNADVLITLSGVPGYFTTFSGIEFTSSRPQYSDGLSSRKLTAATGSTEYADVTVSRSYDPENSEDKALMQWLDDFQYGGRSDISVQLVRRNKKLELRGGKSAFTMVGCLVKNYKLLSDSDTMSGDSVQKIEITFTVDDVSYDTKNRG